MRIVCGWLAAFGLTVGGMVGAVRHTHWPQAPPPSPDQPLLVVLTAAGGDRDGLPVYTRHPNAPAYEAVLAQGFSGRLLRLFRWEQQLVATRDGTHLEPAYLLISRHEGGFPRYGFWLDGQSKRGVGYVDLHERLDGSGRFGALDQIFPHELMHIIVRQLAGPPPPGSGSANQVHAIGVRTDRVTAFDEGFAEHAQVMAIDDPDARPLTAALRGQTAARTNATDRLRRYERALNARWALAPPARLSFVTWFSQAEQALRYHAVKVNAFAREPSIRMPRSGGDDLYEAYLLEQILPGPENGPVKATARLLTTEGVVSALFSGWMNDPVMRRPASEALYARFGTRAGVVAPIEHAYLKLFGVLADGHPHETAALVRAYVATFPEEQDAVATLVRRMGFTWPLRDDPEIWLANDRFMTGTTVFDQYRAMPRIHTFDLNAASLVDLLSIDGTTPELAVAIQRGAPFTSTADLARIPGMTTTLRRRVNDMQAGMVAVREANAREDIESIDLAGIIRPIVTRVTVWALVAAVAGAVLYRAVRRVRPWRAAITGVAAVVLGLLPAWALGSALQVGERAVDPSLFVLLPVVICGIPAALVQLVRRRPAKDAARVLAAWALACLPALLITVPLF